MTKECCAKHGLLLPCDDCTQEELAGRICSTCEAPVSFDYDLLDDPHVRGRRHHSDPTECSAMFNSSGYRDEQIAALGLDGADYPMPELTMMKRFQLSPPKPPGELKSENPNCSVLGCYLPRDEACRDGYHCWCTLHGRWYAARRALAKVWHVKLVAAHKKEGLRDNLA